MSKLPLVMQEMLNTPLAMTESTGLMLAAALAGKLDIQSIATAGNIQLDGRDMARLAQQGRLDADADRAVRKRGPWGELIEGETFKRSARSPSTAVIEVSGVLTRTWGVESYSGTTGYDGVRRQFDDALEDKSIRAIWFQHNSGGGAVNGMFDLADYINAHGYETTGKRTIGMASDYSFSASYCLLAACDHPYMPEAGGVGSVGCLSMVTSYKRMLEQDGIDVRIVRSPDLKAKPHQFEDIEDEDLKLIQDEVDHVTDMFQQRVALYRGISQQVVVDTRGRTYMGREAKAIGFVDEVLSPTIVWEALQAQLALDEGDR